MKGPLMRGLLMRQPRGPTEIERVCERRGMQDERGQSNRKEELLINGLM